MTIDTRDAAPDRRPDRGDGPLAEDEVVADERAVEVERDEPDRERRLRARRSGSGAVAAGSGPRLADGVALTGGPAGPAAGRRGPSRRRRCQPGSTAATAAGASVALVAADLEQRDAVVGEDVRQAGEERADDVEAVRAAVERRSRLERGGDRQPGDRVGADVRAGSRR